MTREYDSPLHELRSLIARLELMPGVNAASLERSAKATDEEIGGRRPAGGVDWKGDREEGYGLKSAEYFKRRMSWTHSEVVLSGLVVEARAAVEAWTRLPLVEGQEPEFGSPQWKRWVAESRLDGGELARKFNVTRQYIAQVRKAYREAA